MEEQKVLLVGNGINIQFDKINYTAKAIVLRFLDDLNEPDYPKNMINSEPYLMKWYMGQLFLNAKKAFDGGLNTATICSAERIALVDFIKRYSNRRKSLRIADIGFEDYYLLHDLTCHLNKIGNPEQYYVRESMKMGYFHAIYNHGMINKLYKKYSDKFIEYLSSFDSIFSTNYDSNIELGSGKEVYHIHGQFDKLSDVYNPDSFRNQLSDNALKDIPNDPKYLYLHSTAVTTYCGDYKQYQLKQNSLANEALEKMSKAYLENMEVKESVKEWKQEDNQILVNLAEAIELKSMNPELHFQEYYPIKEMSEMTGDLSILGLSPANDFHLFEIIDNAELSKCVYYFFDQSECEKIKTLLPKLYMQKKLSFSDVKEFWRNM